MYGAERTVATPTSSTTSRSTTRTTRCRRSREGDPTPIETASCAACTGGRTPRTARRSRRPCCSPARRTAPPEAAADELAEHYDVGVDLWSATSYKSLREDALAVERWNRLHPGQPRTHAARRRALLADAPGPIVAVTDFMKIVPEQIARFAAAAARSSRSAPTAWAAPTPAKRCGASSRSTMANVVVAVLPACWPTGEVGAGGRRRAIDRYGIDPEGRPLRV